MTRYRFTAEDCDVSLPGNVRVMSPEKANALLEQWEKESPKVRGTNAMGEWFDFGNMSEPHSPSRTSQTHTAILWNPQSIGKGEG